jgi:hypothetical protein
LNGLIDDARPCLDRAKLDGRSLDGSFEFSVTPDDDGRSARTCIAPMKRMDPTLMSCLADVVHAVRARGVAGTFGSFLVPAALPHPRAPYAEVCSPAGSVAGLRPPTYSTDGAPEPKSPSKGRKVSGAEAAIASGKAKIRECYQTELDRLPDLGGRMKFHLSIDGTGRVVRTCTVGTGTNPEMRACVLQVLRGLTFDPPEGGSATITGNFSFVNEHVEGWAWAAAW